MRISVYRVGQKQSHFVLQLETL